MNKMKKANIIFNDNIFNILNHMYDMKLKT